MRRSRSFWSGVCVVPVAVLLIFGVPLTIGGTDVTPLPAAYAAVQRYLPGGVHTYGAMMLVFAAAIVRGLLPSVRGNASRKQHRRLVGSLGATAGMAAGIVLGFFVSWCITGLPLWQPATYWSTIGFVAGWCAWFAPPPSPLPDEAERVA